MFSLGGVGQGASIQVPSHKPHVNTSIMRFESPAWGLLEQDGNLYKPKASLSSSHIWVLLRSEVERTSI